MPEIKKDKIYKLCLLSAILAVACFNFNNQKALAVDCDIYDGDAKKDCEDLQDKAKDYEKIINLKEKQENTIQSQLQLINLEQSRNQMSLQDTKKKVEDLEKKIKSLENEIEEKNKLMESQKKILSGLMQSYFEDYQSGVLEIVMAEKDFSEMANSSDYLNQTSTKVGDVLKEMQEVRSELEKEQNDLEKSQEESENAKTELEKKNLNLQKNEDQKEIILGQTQEEKAKYEKLLNDIEDEINGLNDSKGEADVSSLPPLKKGYFTYPVNPVVITQKYGKTSFSRHYTTGRHNGVDFGIKYKNVYAAKGGKVLTIGNNGRYGYGRWIAIDHGDGLVTLYGHLSKQSVSKGEKVGEGDTIGVSGNTGYSTGPHLHFSVFSKKSFEVVESTKVSGVMLPTGSSVDPMRYLK